MKKLIYLIIIISFACNQSKDQTQTSPYAMVLGVAQDAGYPQMSCKKKCCEDKLTIIEGQNEIQQQLNTISFHQQTFFVSIGFEQINAFQDFKTHFAQILRDIQKGKFDAAIITSYDRKVGVFFPHPDA